MATRSERVRLELESNAAAEAAKIAAALALINRELHGLGRGGSSNPFASVDRDARKAARSIDDAGRSIERTSRSVEKSGNSLDRFSGRLALMAQAGLAIGPSLGAAAVPALTGLASSLGAGALAAGTAVLAFHGVGESLTALGEYQAAPTAANLEKVQAAMAKMGPEAQHFAVYLTNLKPQLTQLQRAAQVGLLPGLEDSITTLMTRAPQVQTLLTGMSTAMGDMARGAASDLAGPKFDDLFSGLNANAPALLKDMGAAAGNLAAGLLNLLGAFMPLSRDFSSGLADMSRSFRSWTEGLDQTQGFQDFVDYIRESGPRVLSTMASLGNALLQVAEAAAPLGGPTLAALRTFADVIAKIADSPIGPPMMAAVGALSLYNKTLGTLGKSSPLAGAAVSKLGMALQINRGGRIDATRAGLKGMKADIGTLASSWGTAGARTERESARMSAATKSLKGNLGSVAKSAGPTAAGMALMAASQTGLAKSAGLSNTAMLAGAGMMAGPWGAAAGAAAGMVLDFAHATDESKAATTALNAAMSSNNWAAFTAGAADASSQLKGLKEGSVLGVDLGKKMNGIGGALIGPLANIKQFKGGLDGSTDAMKKSEKAADHAKQAMGGISAAFGGSKKGASDLAMAADRAAPAMKKLGISYKDLGKMGGPERAAAVQQIVAMQTHMETTVGAAEGMGDALNGLKTNIQGTAAGAQALAASMDALFGAAMSQSQADDAWSSGLKTLKSNLQGTGAAVLGQSDGALKSREAIRGSVQQLQDKVKADAAAGVSGGVLVNSMLRGRQAIIDQGVAAGKSRPQMAAYLAQLNMSPKTLAPIIMKADTLSATQKVQALTRLYNLTPKQVKTMVSQSGGDRSAAMIQRLAAQYHKTPRQIRTLLQASDQASGKLRGAKKAADGLKSPKPLKVTANTGNVLGVIGKVGKAALGIKSPKPIKFSATGKTDALDKAKKAAAGIKNPKPIKVSANAGNTFGVIAGVKAAIASVQGKTVTITTVHKGANAFGGMYMGNVRTFATGGLDIRNGHIPHIAAAGTYRVFAEDETGGEAYIPLANDGRRSRAIAIWQQTGRILGQEIAAFASGGLTGVAPAPSTAGLSAPMLALVTALNRQTAATLSLTTANSRLESAQNRVGDAQTAVSDAQGKVSDLGEAPTRLSSLQALQAVREDQKALHAKGKNRLKGVARQVAKAQLAEDNAAYAKQLSYAQNLAAAKARVTAATRAQSAAIAAQARAQAALDAAQAKSDATNDVMGGMSLSGITSTAAADRYITTQISNMGQFVSAMAQLRQKNASPWLLQQLRQLGPSTGAIKLAKQYLASPAALDKINAEAEVLTAVGNSYGSLVGDSRFGTSAGWGDATSVLNKTVEVSVTALDASTIAAEVSRVVRHEITAQQAAGAL